MQEVIERPSDLLARYGGEEFVCILPGTARDGAVHIAENLRKAVEFLGEAHEKSNVSEVVTISLGIATTTPIAE